MGHGKKAVWDITDPARPESVFHNMLTDTPMQHSFDTSAPIPADIWPAAFYSLFNVADGRSSAETNPYHNPCFILSVLWNQEIDDHNIIFFLTFITQIDPNYRALIEEKDPRALLLLLYWHSAVVPHERWWLRRRCGVEAKAICMYLEKYCADDDEIMELLQEPKARLAKRV